MRQRAKTYLLCEQSNGRHRDPILHNGADDPSLDKHLPETPPVLLGSLSDYTYESTTLKHLTQTRFVWTNVEMGY